MKTKFLLPVLAMIFAIGMSFTTVNDTDANDYILLEDDSWRPIGEQPCTPGFHTCRVQDGVDGEKYDVYDEMDQGTKKTSTSEDPFIITLNL